MSLSSHIVRPREGSPHTHTIILLHGRDSEAEEFASEFFECEATGPEADDHTLTALLPTVRWVFPQAKTLHSERFDTDMSQWFDIWTLEDLQERNELQVSGIQLSVDLLINIIKDEERLVPRDRIFLGGISQGFTTSLAALFADGKGGFAGLCGFCSWFPLIDEAVSLIRQYSDSIEQRLAALQRLYAGDPNKDGKDLQLSAPEVSQLQSTPILLEHSRDDLVISIENGMPMRDILKHLGFSDVEWHEYDGGGHWVNEPQGVDHFVSFLRRAIGE